MNHYSLFHLTDGALERGMLELFADDRRRTARLIAYIAEFGERRLYARDGYATMHEWCVDRVKLSDDAARKRIQAAQAARKHPILFEALADGRLHLTAIVLLAPHLTAENVADLVAEATHLKVEQIRLLIARHFPRPDVEALVRPLGLDASGPGLVLKPGDAAGPNLVGDPGAGVVLKPLEPLPPARVAPLSPGRYETRFTIGQETHEVLRRLEQLLGRKLSTDELDEALGRGLEAMIAAFEKRRFAATDRPRRQRRPARGRRVSAAVMREVSQRDEQRCTFVSPDGRRCAARAWLEYDHVHPVARGVDSGPKNVRLLCRAHNQYMAEQAFGAGFMREKRERARRAAEVRRVRAAAARREETERTARRARAGTARPASEPASPAATPAESDVVPWLLRLGFKAQEARRAAARCDAMPGAPLEDRVRAALSFLAPPARVSGARPGPAPA